MDVHKPKPIQGLKELASEIGVIVIGILIALGLEQAVDSWHHREDVASARIAIRAELVENLVGAAMLKDQEQCTRVQLDELANALGRNDSVRVRSLIAQDTFPRPGGWPKAAWEAFLASDASKSFDRAERGKYSGLYSFVDAMDRKQERYVDAYARLRALATTGLGASPQAVQGELSDMAEMTAALSDMRDLADQFPISARASANLEVPPNAFVPPEFVAQQAGCHAAARAIESSHG